MPRASDYWYVFKGQSVSTDNLARIAVWSSFATMYQIHLNRGC